MKYLIALAIFFAVATGGFWIWIAIWIRLDVRRRLEAIEAELQSIIREETRR